MQQQSSEFLKDFSASSKPILMWIVCEWLAWMEPDIIVLKCFLKGHSFFYKSANQVDGNKPSAWWTVHHKMYIAFFVTYPCTHPQTCVKNICHSEYLFHIRYLPYLKVKKICCQRWLYLRVNKNSHSETIWTNCWWWDAQSHKGPFFVACPCTHPQTCMWNIGNLWAFINGFWQASLNRPWLQNDPA